METLVGIILVTIAIAFIIRGIAMALVALGHWLAVAYPYLFAAVAIFFIARWIYYSYEKSGEWQRLRTQSCFLAILFTIVAVILCSNRYVNNVRADSMARAAAKASVEAEARRKALAKDAPKAVSHKIEQTKIQTKAPEFVVIEESEQWAQKRKDALLNELLAPLTERKKAILQQKRREEDRAFNEAERAEIARNAAALDAAEEMDRRIKEMGFASDRQEDELRTFALKESPHIWQTIQYLRAQMVVQDAQIAKVKQTSLDNRVPYKNDPDFQKACMLRNKLVRSLRVVEDHLVAALVAYREYAAAPSKTEYECAMRKALEDGILEADLVKKQYEDMKNGK